MACETCSLKKMDSEKLLDNTSQYSCLNFTTEFAKAVLDVKASLGAITVVVNLLAIALIVISKKYKDFTFRLVIYLMVTDILQAVTMCLALAPVYVPDAENAAKLREGQPWHEVCEITGFLLMVSMWMGNVVIIWIVGHLLVLGWRLYRVQVTGATLKRNDSMLTKNGEGRFAQVKWEMIGICIMIIGPFVIGVIPFVIDDDMYGISGLWCWIRIINTHCGDLKSIPLTVVLVLFYGPLLLIVFFSVISMFATIVLVCYGAVRRHGVTIVDQHQRRMKEIMLVLAYPMLYCTVCLLLLANRIYSIAHYKSQPFVPLWMTHTVADPVRVMLPAVAFLLHPYVWRDLCNGRKSIHPTESPPREADHSNSVNNGSIENKLLASQDDRNSTYGAFDDDDTYMSLLVRTK